MLSGLAVPAGTDGPVRRTQEIRSVSAIKGSEGVSLIANRCIFQSNEGYTKLSINVQDRL